MLELEDDYEHQESIEYVLENVLMPDDGSNEFKRLRDDYNSLLTASCRCSITYDCNENNRACCHGGRFKYNENANELVLRQKVYNYLPALIECNDLCHCSANVCKNRLVQYGPRKNLEIFDSPRFKSKGLRTTTNIPCGAFICEYAGELLTLSEAKRRLELIDKHGQMNYILCLNEYANSNGKTKIKSAHVTCVDPCERGNIGRYLNHSCNPNCDILPVRINCPVPKICKKLVQNTELLFLIIYVNAITGIFAKRDIAANEELCFHYGGGDSNEGVIGGKLCLCAAPNCAGVIPNTSI